MEVIDTNTHIGCIDKWHYTCDSLIYSMRKFNIAKGIVSTISGNEFDYELKRIRTNKNQIEINDEMLQEIKTHKDKLKAFFWIRPYSEEVDQNLIDYLEFNKDWYVGLKVSPRYANLKFTVENYKSYLDLCRRLRLPFCIHTENDGFSNMEFIYQVAKKYSDVVFIAVHMELGESNKNAIKYINKCPNLFGDTTLIDIDDVIEAIKTCGSNKILFGSDAVIFGEESYHKYFNYNKKLYNSLNRSELEDLFCNNAKKIFKL